MMSMTNDMIKMMITSRMTTSLKKRTLPPGEEDEAPFNIMNDTIGVHHTLDVSNEIVGIPKPIMDEVHVSTGDTVTESPPQIGHDSPRRVPFQHDTVKKLQQREEERSTQGSHGVSCSRQIRALVISHRNSFKKEFQGPSDDGNTDAMQFTSIGVESEEDYNNMHTLVNDTIMHITHDICLTQMSAKKGIHNHGNKAIQCILKEFTQLYGKKVVGHLNPDTLSLEEKMKVLREITLIKEKRCGRLNDRTCADGHKQRPYISKEESASPTVSAEDLTITSTFYIHVNRDIIT